MKRWFANAAAEPLPRLDIVRAAEIIRESAGTACFITGAGVSTESGIPDYRGPAGRYVQTKSKPLTHQEYMGDERNRKRFWARSMIGFRSFDVARPNRSHFAIAELERHHHLSGVITQNVDRLHHRAGSRNVIELHGRGDMVECMTCGHQKLREEYHKELEEENAIWVRERKGKTFTPTADGDAIIDESDVHSFCVLNCSECAVGILKPSYVFFGGSVPPDVAESAMDLVQRTKALFLIGSTASTFSCYRLIRAAHEQGSFVAIVNKGATRGDEYAKAAYDEDSCGHFLERLLGELVPR